VTIIGSTYAPGRLELRWAFGDFDYDGRVNDDDVTLISALYNPQATPPTPAISSATKNRQLQVTARDDADPTRIRASAAPIPAPLFAFSSNRIVPLHPTARRIDAALIDSLAAGVVSEKTTQAETSASERIMTRRRLRAAEMVWSEMLWAFE
jgi:hypothetical protein